jgi:outer membrane beta-barrel protein
MTYTNLSAGFNVLPGEVFIGSALARPSGLYLIGGLGSTELLGEKHHTVNFGLGLRLFLKDWAAIQVDMRDHVFALDVLGRRRSTQNLELTLGATFYF